MIFFTSAKRVKELPLHKKVILYPIAYMLKFGAGAVIHLADKFDEVVTYELITIREGEVK